MSYKILEVRDRMTFVPVLAVKMLPNVTDPIEAYAARNYLLRRCGYGIDFPVILITRLSGDGTPSWSDPYGWADRTFTVAHNYIVEHWAELEDGDVVDVEFILGETKAPKVSERVEH